MQGENEYGQLGDGTASSSDVPVAVAEEGPWVTISARNRLSCARKVSNEVWCWYARQRGFWVPPKTNGHHCRPPVLPNLHFHAILGAGGS